MKNKFILGLLLALSSVSLMAQDSGAPAGIYMSNADIEAKLNEVTTGAASAGGSAVNIAPGISVRRRNSSVEQYAIVHPWSMEVYRILAGSGTFVTGGLLILPMAESTDPNIVRTLHGISGGLARQVSAGDILVLQPGTPHWFSKIDGESITYMESRIQISTHPIQYQLP